MLSTEWRRLSTVARLKKLLEKQSRLLRKASSIPRNPVDGICERECKASVVLALAQADGVTPAVAADRVAEERIRSVGRLRGVWVPGRA